MIKGPLASIAAISGAAGLMATCIFLHNAAMASVEVSSDKTTLETDQSHLWGGAYFPVDDYDGQELGRKIGDWVVAKIKNR